MERATAILPADYLGVARSFYADRPGFSVRRRPPKDEEWGARTFDLVDPFGNTIFVMGPPTVARDLSASASE